MPQRLPPLPSLGGIIKRPQDSLTQEQKDSLNQAGKIRSLMNDRQFRGLGRSDQRHLLSLADPQFGELDDAELGSFLRKNTSAGSSGTWAPSTVNRLEDFALAPLLPISKLVPDPKEFESPTARTALSVVKGATEAIEGLTSPLMLGIGAATWGLGSLAAGATTATGRTMLLGADTALSVYFASEMGSALLDSTEGAMEAYQAGDIEETARLLGYGTVSGLMAAVAGSHAVKKARAIPSARQNLAPAIKDIISKDPQMEAALTAHQKGTPLREYGDWIGNRLVYEWKVRKFPELRNDIRLMKDAGMDAAHRATGELVQVLNPLRSGKEYDLFRRIVVLEDFVATGGRGLKLPRDIDLDTFQVELTRLQKLAERHAGVKESLNRHQELAQRLGKELEAQGKLSPEAADRPYYTHEILDYSEGMESRLPGIPRQLRTPSRLYTKTRVGSVRDINTNYENVMFRHTAKIHLDNAISDFIVKTAGKYDLTRGMDKDTRAALWSQRDKPFVTLPDGKRAEWWQPDPGNNIYRGSTINEKLVNEALAKDLKLSEFMEMEGPRGGKPIQESLLLGGAKESYLLESPIAERLTQFRTPQGEASLLSALTPAIGLWKRVTLDFAGLPYQMNNLGGDLFNLYLEDAGALLKIPEAVRALRKNAPEELKALRELAYHQRVIETSGLFGGEVIGRYPTPERSAQLSKIHHSRRFLNPLNIVGETMFQIEKVSAFRESVPRLSKFLKDVERIKQGKQVVTTSNIEGLSPIDAAGKAAREFTVDYGAVTPTFSREIRGLMYPFATFYVQNAKNWARSAYKKPGNMTIKIGVPLGMMWVWNNTGERREIEAGLPEWERTRPHLITGYQDRKGKNILMGFQTPVDLAAKMGGLDQIPILAQKVRDGELTIEQAVKEQAKNTALAIPRQFGITFEDGGVRVGDLANFAARAIIDLAANQDSFTRRTIVPERLKGTPEGDQLRIEYALGQTFVPYAAYMRAGRNPEPGQQFAKAMIQGPLDVPRALGYRAVAPERHAISEQYKAQQKADVDYQSRMERLERAYLAAQGKTQDPGFQRVLVQIQQEGPIPSDAIRSRFKSLRVQRLLLEERMSWEVSPERREKMLVRLRAIRLQQTEEARKRVPKATRPAPMSIGPVPPTAQPVSPTPRSALPVLPAAP